MNKRRPGGVFLFVKRSVVIAAMVLVGCSPGLDTAPSTSSTRATAASTTSSTTARVEDLPECRSGPPKPGIDLQYEEIIRFYELRNPEKMFDLIGDGPVFDPSLEPEGSDTYPDLATWLAAASRMTDQWSDRGYGFGEPFRLFLQRRNPTLRDAGIEGLDITFEFWLTQDCELRVATTDIVSSPDPCRYFELYDVAATPLGCLGSFEPRASHAAVWTGDELLVFGGTNGAEGEPLRTGLAYSPDTGNWRELPMSPLAMSWWPATRVLWTGSRVVMAGSVRDEDWGTDDDDWYTEHLLFHNSGMNQWESVSFPEERQHIGAVVWTGEEVLSVGGDQNAPDNTGWAYRPETGQWRQLPDPGIEPVEEFRGVWTGSEALFIGGYAFQAGDSPAAAYDPKTDSWRQLAPPPGGYLDSHELVWTGAEVIVYSGHTGPRHNDHLLLYDPAADSWRESSSMPMLPAERLAGAWTGDRLIIWGGYATYGEHDEDGDHVYGHGALYDPVTDAWELLPEAPISDRCDHSGTWTGSEFIVFGGMPLCGTPGILPLGDAAAYDPATKTWRLIEK
jgi:hypothetical protein